MDRILKDNGSPIKWELFSEQDKEKASNLLIAKYKHKVRRCPRCSMVFLPVRRNCIYCSRKCQSVAVMRRIRANG